MRCFNNQAVTSLISVVLIMVIFFASVGIIFLWGLPAVNESKINAQRGSSFANLDLVDSAIDELLQSGVGGFQRVSIQSEGDLGSIYVDSESERFITMYTRDPSYDINVSDLDDKDRFFNISAYKDGTQIGVANVTMYWMNETCFLAGTQVLMADDSYKNIEDIIVGDFVKSYDTTDDELIGCRVNQVFCHESFEMAGYYLKINDDLCVTPNHRFYSHGGWVYADDLVLGDYLFNGKDSFLVCSIERICEKEVSYDLSIENVHNYFVMVKEDRALVHNAEPEPSPDPEPEHECFMPDTPINMADGAYKQIKDIRIGDMVKVFNEKTGEIDTAAVNKIQTTYHDNVHELFLENGKMLRPTANHPFYAKDKGWVTISGLDELGIGAGRLVVGDYLYCLQIDGSLEWVKVIDLVAVEGNYLTYNLIDMKHGTFLADDIVTHNSGTEYPPVALNPDPDDEIDVEISPTLSVDVKDKNGGSVTTYFYDSSDTLLGKNNSAVPYTASTVWLDAKEYSTTYRWYVKLDDGGLPVRSPSGHDYYNFTTVAGNQPPIKPNTPSPSDGATGISTTQNLGWSGGDPDGDSVTYDIYLTTADSDELGAKRLQDQLDTGHPAGSTVDVTKFNPGELTPSSHYYWMVNASDGTDYNLGPIWDFKTEASTGDEPYDPVCVQPWDDSFDVNLTPVFKVDVSDPNGDTLAVYFYWSNGTLIGRVAGVSSGDTAKFDYDDTGKKLDYDSIYCWYAVAKDPASNTNASNIWCFTTLSSISLDKPSKPNIVGTFDELYNDTRYTFHCSHTESDLKYAWDFDGDKKIDTSWILDNGGFSEPGINTEYTWSEPGLYMVRVKVREQDGSNESAWSDPLPIRIIEKERHPGNYLRVLSSKKGEIDVEDMGSPQTIKITTSNVPAIKGTVAIELFNDSYPVGNPGNVSFGVICVFDLGSLSQSIDSELGIYDAILQNDGIYASKPNMYMWNKPFLIDYINNASMIHFIQIRNPNDKESAAGRGLFSFKISYENLNILDNAERKACNLKIQVFGENRELWINYLTNKGFFIKQIPTEYPNTYCYTVNKETNLVVKSSIFNIDLEKIT